MYNEEAERKVIVTKFLSVLNMAARGFTPKELGHVCVCVGACVCVCVCVSTTRDTITLSEIPPECHLI